jgi:hypothetical protein
MVGGNGRRLEDRGIEPPRRQERPRKKRERRGELNRQDAKFAKGKGRGGRERKEISRRRNL